jgi:hypothetical protein
MVALNNTFTTIAVAAEPTSRHVLRVYTSSNNYSTLHCQSGNTDVVALPNRYYVGECSQLLSLLLLILVEDWRAKDGRLAPAYL